MDNGIYHVHFSSSIGDMGTGIVVIKDGSVNGGDLGYLYVGNTTSDGNSVSGTLNIKRWNPSHTSVFGSIDSFDLSLSGQFKSDKSFTLTGSMVSQPQLSITIQGRYLSPAA